MTKVKTTSPATMVSLAMTLLDSLVVHLDGPCAGLLGSHSTSNTADSCCKMMLFEIFDII